MKRRRYLVTYDISDPKRWRKVHDVALEFGEPFQYSVFLCDVDRRELVQLHAELSDAINHAADRVAIIDLGEPGRADVTVLGVPKPLPNSGPRIV